MRNIDVEGLSDHDVGTPTSLEVVCKAADESADPVQRCLSELECPGQLVSIPCLGRKSAYHLQDAIPCICG